MVTLRQDKITALTPNALPVCREAFLCAESVLTLFGILQNEQRAAHFLAQVFHESGGLRLIRENLFYTTPERLMQVWKIRFPTRASALPFVRNPEALANKVYARENLGNTQPGDGWKYIGRGLIQITGKHNYRRIGSALDVDFVSHPEWLLEPQYLLSTAAQFWRAADCNTLADSDDIRAVTKAINGGFVGLADRQQWLEKTRAVVRTKPAVMGTPLVLDPVIRHGVAHE